MLCKLCDSLNVTDLINLAKANVAGTDLEDRSAKRWKHHSKYDDLAAAARAGCELCKLIMSSMEHTVQRPPWNELTYKEALLENEKDGILTGLSVTLEAVRSNEDDFGKRKVLDRLCFCFGRQYENDVPLVLSLQKPRGSNSL